MIAHHGAIGDGGGLSDAFARETLGIAEYFRDAGGTSNLPLEPDGRVGTSLVPPPADTLQTETGSQDADFFRLNEEVDPIFWVEPGYFDSTVTPDQSTERAHLGVAADHGDGRIGVVTFLLSRSNGLRTAADIGAALLRDILGL